jgi:hypothetical protein
MTPRFGAIDVPTKGRAWAWGPIPDGEREADPVSLVFGNVRNQGPKLAERVELS